MAVFSAIGAGLGWLGANALAIGALAGTVKTVNDIKAGDDQRAENKKLVAEQKARELVKRKELIDTQRLQMGLQDEGRYSTMKTAEAGLKSLTGEVLG